MLARINNAIYRYYITTWVFILILFKRQIPKWMHKKTVDIMEPEIFQPIIEKYVR